MAMNEASPAVSAPAPAPELLTLIAVSCLAYVLELALHEHAGHSAACVLLGGRPLEMGAFYVVCDYRGLSPLDVRLVAIAGPAVSLIVGFACLALLARVRGPVTSYFVWLLGTLGLMSASGYPLFSGITGIGDLGTETDGALHGASPEWLWRIVLTVAGILAYLGTVYFSLARIEPFLSGVGRARLAQPRRATLVSYLTGVAAYVVIGAFNPYGWQIVLTSVLPSAMGGTSGLLWMFSVANRTRSAAGTGIAFERQWGWIAAGALFTVCYAWLFARTYRWP
jgi:hypothetical protein